MFSLLSCLEYITILMCLNGHFSSLSKSCHSHHHSHNNMPLSYNVTVWYEIKKKEGKKQKGITLFKVMKSHWLSLCTQVNHK